MIKDYIVIDVELKLKKAVELKKHIEDVFKAVKVESIESLTNLDLCEREIHDLKRLIIETDQLVRIVKLSGGPLT